MVGLNREQPVSEDPESARQGTDLILDLNFVPEWARTPPKEGNYYAQKDSFEDGDTNRRHPAKQGHRNDGRRKRKDTRDGGNTRPRQVQEKRVRERLPILVRFLPGAHSLESIVRLMRRNRRAYPLINLASLFLNRPDSCDVRIEVEESARDISFFQCKLCGHVFTARSTEEAHVIGVHLSDYFHEEEKTVEPPSGNFLCIARCGLSGVLLGPPNHHSFEEKLKEVHRLRYPHMGLDEYRRHVEMVRDQALIDAWKQEYARQKVYKRIDSSGVECGEPMKRVEAEAWMAANVAGVMVVEVRKAVLRASVARSLEDDDLRWAVESAWSSEMKFPRTLLIALRGALAHRFRMHIFRAGRIGYFASSIKPFPIDPDHAVDAVRRVLIYLREHPGSTRDEMMAALIPALEEGSDEAKELLRHLTWLIERGHVIEFFDGTLSVPLAKGKASVNMSGPGSAGAHVASESVGGK